MPTLLKPGVYVPDGYGAMIRVDPEGPLFVRKADFDDMVKQFELELGVEKKVAADVRQNNMSASQREARWMMIDTRLRKSLTDAICHRSEQPAYAFADALLQVLNSDPPIGEGFQSVKGLSLSEVRMPTPPGRIMGTDAYTHSAITATTGYASTREFRAAVAVNGVETTQGVESKLKEDANHVRAGIEPDHM